ncbi:MAG TPA: ferrochelatase [Candidatus Dormibacteraeota bacterium]|nr:ferrochelatase [Candidatus Dormibacteraeota bacterium]
MAAYDAVLLIAFGGPERMEDVRPFLANVLRGRPAPPERVEEVVHHYELIGGRSPLTELTLRQATALQTLLAETRPALPVYVGMRNWHPYLADTLAAMQRDGVRRAVGLILAAQQNDAGWGRYQRDVAEARAALGDAAPAVDFAPNWHAHPLFIDAVADRARHALAALPAARRRGIQLVFTAHSIPLAMAAAAPYEGQLRIGAALVAEHLGFRDHRLAYQSRSGNPRDPWLEPDIGTLIREEAGRGTRELLVVPIGFVCDHVEVLYDLDIEARQIAAAAGIGFTRAETVNDHPSFIRMLAALVAAQAAT